MTRQSPHTTDTPRPTHDSDSQVETNVHHSRRGVLKALGILGAVSVAGSGTALGTQLDALVAAGHLTTSQAAQLFTEVEKLTASDADDNDWFGWSLSVSGDGTTALVGAPLDDHVATNSGSAYVYNLTQDPPSEIKLTASDAAAADRFGDAVSVSGDGTTALVGALFGDDAATNSGSAYVYDLTQDPPTETKLTSSAAAADRFGDAVSVSGDGTTALVGAPHDDDGGIGSGAVYVYDLTQNPPSETKLTASDAATNDVFGSAVSVSGDGTTVLIGTPLDDDGGTDSGSAYVYDLTLSPPTETKLTASDAADEDRFGIGVSVSEDGTTALIGAPYDDDGGTDSGSVYVYDLTQDPPSQIKLTASDAASGDFFGDAVSVSGDGTTALIGAPHDDDGGTDSGSAYIYDLTQDPPTETKLIASDAADDGFGDKVSVSADGTTALVGAFLADTDAGTDVGLVYVFELVFPDPIVLPNGTVVTPVDHDGDGLTEDLDGDGDVDGQDVSRLTQLENAYRKGEIHLTAAQIAALDFDGDGQFTKADVDAYSDRYGL